MLDTLDNVFSGRTVFRLPEGNQRDYSVGYAFVVADSHWSLYYNRVGIYHGMHRKLVVGLGDMGLQQHSGQYPGPGVPTVLWTVAGGGLGWDHSGRLPAILVVW